MNSIRNSNKFEWMWIDVDPIIGSISFFLYPKWELEQAIYVEIITDR